MVRQPAAKIVEMRKQPQADSDIIKNINERL
jgi:hypothetical protein